MVSLHVVQAGLQLTEVSQAGVTDSIPVLASWMLGLQLLATVPGFKIASLLRNE